MSEPKWTAGPWMICNEGNCTCKQVWCSDHPVAAVTRGKWGDDFPSIRVVGDTSLDLKAEAYMEQITYGEITEETAKANAHLISAAPDLYAMLELAIDLVDREHGPHYSEVQSDGRKILAKARGEA